MNYQFRFVIMLCFFGAQAFFPSQTKAGDSDDSPLFNYVLDDSDEVSYTPRFEVNASGMDVRVYDIASQVWQGHQLYNQMYIAMPKGVSKDTTHAMFFITGSSFYDHYLEPAKEEEIERFRKKLRLYGIVAKRLKTPIAVVRFVPFQRMQLCDSDDPRGNKEDDLIACTFRKFLDSGDETWPALLPMTKSAHVALDVAQEAFRDEWGMNVESFTALGTSKRGWTTFLLAAVDDRVTGAVPVVIDMLNMNAHLDLQLSAWDTHSVQIQDYANYDIFPSFSTPMGQRLISIVDPFAYREHLEKPILMILGTNDRYWPVDAANLYYPELPGKKYLLYLPNQGHKAEDYNRVIAGSRAFNKSIADNIPLPEFEWDFWEEDGRLKVGFESSIRPSAVSLWRAESRSRDFRDSRFKEYPICGINTNRGRCKAEHLNSIDISKNRCATHYIEFWFRHDGLKRYPLTSTQFVTGGEKCLSTEFLVNRDKTTEQVATITSGQ